MSDLDEMGQPTMSEKTATWYRAYYDLRELLKKYMRRVVNSEGVYFIYDDIEINLANEEEYFTKEGLAVLRKLMDELAAEFRDRDA